MTNIHEKETEISARRALSSDRKSDIAMWYSGFGSLAISGRAPACSSTRGRQRSDPDETEPLTGTVTELEQEEISADISEAGTVKT